jgi:hypothetical protein
LARIYIGGAGGAPSNNFIRSLRESGRGDHLIGATSTPSDLFLADTDEKYVVPPANHPAWAERMLAILRRTRPDFLHVQHDYEVAAVSGLRQEIEALGVRLFMPAHQTIVDCIDKERSYALWAAAGVKVPETRRLNTPEELRDALADLGPRIWLRATKGAGGRGALPVSDFEFARLWIDHFNGWGDFTASRLLTPQTVTWLSIWHEGRLVVAQTRRRRSWNFGDRTLSGVTGITGVGETASDPLVDRVAESAVRAVGSEPHGIFAVDMAYDSDGVPNPTEINISRFFTTHYFFTRAGLNMPRIYVELALENRFPELERPLNPLPDGLVWIRGMDVEPVLTSVEELARFEGQVTW